MWLKINNLGKYINNLQKEWVISTMLLSCIYIDMKCVFYVNTLGLLSLKWIKNELNICMLHQMNRIHIMNCDSKVQLPWQVRYLSDMVLIFWSIAIRCACLSALSCVLVRLITHLEEKIVRGQIIISGLNGSLEISSEKWVLSEQKNHKLIKTTKCFLDDVSWCAGNLLGTPRMSHIFIECARNPRSSDWWMF